MLAVAALAFMAIILPRWTSAGDENANQTRRFSSVAELSDFADGRAARELLAGGSVDVAFPDVVLSGADPEQAVFGDLEVRGGEVIEGGVIVYDGDARIESGGVIEGDLVVYSGDIRVDEGGRVDGNVSTFSGDIRVSGDVGGNLTTWSGDINLRDGASIGGDVSVLNGEVKRASGADVGGNVVRGPRLELPPIPAAPFRFGEPGAVAATSLAAANPSAFQRIGSLILRLMGMAILSLLVGALVWLIAAVRPSRVHATRHTLTEQPALSFVVGILANVVLLLAGAFFAITICLLPLMLLTYLLLIGLNVLGWAALAYFVSQRIMQRYDLTMRWDIAVAITAAAMAAALGLLWAFGGCFRFFGFAGMLVVSSIGAGAVLLPFVNKFMGAPATQLPESSSASWESEADVDYDAYSGDVYAGEKTGADETVVDSIVVAQSEVATPVDDFTQIRGIGPVAADRLASAGITSFTALAALSPEELGEILRWSPDRVVQSDITGQAMRLSGENS